MNASTSRLPRRARLLPLAGAVAALFAGPAAAQTAPALPVLANTGQPVNVQVRTAPGQMIVTTTQSRTVIPWASFNVAAGNSVSFKQPDASSAVLNRVITPGTPSTIDGAIDSNGKVYLLNPAGISFGVNSAVSVGALVASTLDMADSDFLNGVDRFRGAPGNGAVVHQGEIVTDTGGSVVLLGSSVTSTGAIRTSGGDVVLAASSADTLLGLANQHLTIDVGNTPAGAVRLGGTLDTSAALGDAGKVTVLASRVELGADLAILSDRQDPAGKGVQVEVRNSTLNVAAQDGTLSGTDASRLLQMADLKLAGTSASDLVVGDAIAWPAPQGASHALTLSSGGNLLVRNRIDATANGAAGSVALEIGQAQPAAGNTATDDFGLSATGFAGRIDLPSGTSFSTRLGSDGSTQVFTVINTPAQLQAAPATNTALGADITWPAAPGASFNPLVKRSGQYDGLGHSVWGLNVVDTGLSPKGMFSQLANSEVRNLALRQPTVQCTVYCGVLAGSTSRAGIRSVWVDGATVNAVTGSYFDGYYDNPVAVQYVGGIVGILGGSSITGSIVSSLTLTAPDNARDLGGVAGFTIGSWELRFGSPNVFFPTTIADTLADRVRIRTGNDMQFLGGLVGENRDATLSRVSASNVSIDTLSTTVSGSGMNAIGGLVGANGGTIDKASGAYVALTVGRNTSGVGGMVGSNGGLITDSRVDAVVLNIGPMDAGAGVPSAIGGFAGMGGSNLYTGTPGSISGSAASNIRMNSSAGLVGVGGFIGVSTDNHAISRSTVNDAQASSGGGGGAVGGFVGLLESGTITDAGASLVSVFGADGSTGVGGFAGRIGPASGSDLKVAVASSYASGTVYAGAGSTQVGGFAGAVAGSVADAYFNGNLSVGDGSTVVAGFAGENRGSIARAYADSSLPRDAAGAVSAPGFVADNSGSVVLSHYNLTRSGTPIAVGSGDASGIDGLDAAAMKQSANFPQWDFSPTGPWFIYEGRTDPLLGHLMTPATVTVIAPDANATYSGLAQTLGGPARVVVTLADGTPGNPNLVSGTRLTTSDGNPAVNAGSYDWIATGAYSSQRGYLFRSVDTQGGHMTIAPAPLTVTANDDSKPYNAGVQGSDKGASFSGFVNGEGPAQLTGSLVVSGGGKDAGTYALTPGGVSSSNYNLQFQGGKLTITPVPLTVTANDDSKTYNGAVQTGDKGARYSGFVGGDGAADLGGTLLMGGGGKDVGTYLITPGGLKSSNYSISYGDGQITITPAPLRVTANDDSKTYNASLQGSDKGASYSGFVGGDDASQLAGTLSVSGTGKDAGTYPLTPGGLSARNYDLQFANGTLTITPAPLKVTANDESKTYNAGIQSSDKGASYSGFVGGDDASQLAGTLSVSGSGKDAGSYVLTPGGLTARNYDLQFATGRLTITPAALTVTANSDSKTYSGAVQGSDKGASFSGFVGGEDASQLSGTLSVSGSGKDAGSYVLTPGGLSARNYNLEFANGTLSITPAPLTVSANDDRKTYNGAAQTGDKGASFSGFVGADGVADLGGTLGMSGGGRDVGSYRITPAGLQSSNYSIRYSDGQITITPAPLKVTANDESKTYNASIQSSDKGASYSGFVGGDDASQLAGTLSVSGSGKDAGSYVLTPGGLTARNYDLQFSNGTLTINPAPLTVTANNDSKTYNGVVQTGDKGASFSGFVGADGAADLGGILVMSGGGKDVGSHAVTPGGLTSSNYSIRFADGQITITPAPLLVTANNDRKTYNGAVQTGDRGASFSGFVGADGPAALGGALVMSGGGKDVGSYAFTPGGLTSSNYSIRYADGLVTIDPAPLVVKANDDSKTYNGGVQSSSQGVSFRGFVGNDGEAQLRGNLTLSGSGKDVGRYVVTPGGVGATNYVIRFASGSLVITPAPLTVTVESDSKVYNGAVQGSDKGARFSGFVGGEGAAQLGGTLSVSGGGRNVGSYTLTPGGLSSANYALRFVDGQITITPAALQVTANDASKTYDGKPYDGRAGASYAGFVGGDGVAQLEGSLAFSGGGTDVGRYSITPGGLSATNYSLQFANGQLTVTPAPLLVTANDATRRSGDGPFTGGNGVRFSGFVPGEGPGQLRGSLGFSGDSQGATQPGTYLIVPGGLEAGNYTIRFLPGSLVITKSIASDLPVDAPTLERVTGISETGGTVGSAGTASLGNGAPALRPLLPGQPHLCIEPGFLRLEGEDRSADRQVCRQPEQPAS